MRFPLSSCRPSASAFDEGHDAMLKINLYPGRKKRPLFKGLAPKWDFDLSLKDRAVFISLAVVGLIIVLSGVSYFMKQHTIGRLNHEIEVAVADSIRYAESIRLINDIQEKEDWIRDRIDVIREVDQHRYIWPVLMAGINDALPPLTWLTRLETISPFPQLVFRVEGNSFSNIGVASFMRELEKLPEIERVTLVVSRENLIEGIPTMAFIIECGNQAGPVNEPASLEGAGEKRGNR